MATAFLAEPSVRPVAVPVPVAPPARSRLGHVDAVRGLVMVIMTLDHVRHFLGGSAMHDLGADSPPAAFLTRWVTHLCAPTFLLLAGAGAFLASRKATASEQARFLLTRGLWLIFLEVTVVSPVWQMRFVSDYLNLQVLWAIGVALVLLAGLRHLPRGLTLALGILLLVGHNTLDAVQLATEPWAGLWKVLHDPAEVALLQGRVLGRGVSLVAFPRYSLVPWVAVVLVGYAGLGPLLLLAPARRRAVLVTLGVGLLAVFIGLRLVNHYGDPRPWTPGATPLETVLAFVDCQKYPCSLAFVLMTFAGAALLLALLDRVDSGPAGEKLATLGQVPLFFYLLHVPAIQALGYLCYVIGSLMGAYAPGLGPRAALREPGLGFGVPGVWAAWVATVMLLYPVCARFADAKRRHPRGWLRYL